MQSSAGHNLGTSPFVGAYTAKGSWLYRRTTAHGPDAVSPPGREVRFGSRTTSESSSNYGWTLNSRALAREHASLQRSLTPANSFSPPSHAGTVHGGRSSLPFCTHSSFNTDGTCSSLVDITPSPKTRHASPSPLRLATHAPTYAFQSSHTMEALCRDQFPGPPNIDISIFGGPRASDRLQPRDTPDLFPGRPKIKFSNPHDYRETDMRRRNSEHSRLFRQTSKNRFFDTLTHFPDLQISHFELHHHALMTAEGGDRPPVPGDSKNTIYAHAASVFRSVAGNCACRLVLGSAVQKSHFRFHHRAEDSTPVPGVSKFSSPTRGLSTQTFFGSVPGADGGEGGKSAVLRAWLGVWATLSTRLRTAVARSQHFPEVQKSKFRRLALTRA
ncbi:hypothetical protein DFP72DRAFT_848997 [Ephemerocybe angulata]|uniref:Uncharacterized protein n=1 Tax=Ephemerocybe angulata TaxID=980116 RepID=A0A8H6M327_9AGAR|nr:hypothetical protein DFP72DRAFT_848997 [Tulosesus angulatus]